MPAARTFVRIALLASVLLAFVLVPFALVGDDLERLSPRLLSDPGSAAGVIAVGIALLALDVVLPVPSSIVSVLLCAAFGPLTGGSAVLFGMVGAFVLGDRIGACVPHDLLRGWMGESVWDSCVARARKHGVLWVALSRPVPVLAEITAVLSGVLGVPLRRSLPVVLASSACVSAGYAFVVWLGLQQSHSGGAFLTIAALPTVSWLVYKLLKRHG
jgi:uncharacterized membrane protein YdjX (TVP38/TMEM64 family)